MNGNRDWRHEFITVERMPDSVAIAVVLSTASGSVIDQLNYTADLVQTPIIPYLGGEMCIPVIRNDSLFSRSTWTTKERAPIVAPRRVALDRDDTPKLVFLKLSDEVRLGCQTAGSRCV